MLILCRNTVPFIQVIFCFFFVIYFSANSFASEKPRLILQITVDQLRGDFPSRYYDRLGEGGLKYLMDNGVVYGNAHHDHANTETIVGHTTLATGAHPSLHGMIGNVWLDRSTDTLKYNVEDFRYPILSEGAGVDKKTEIDPTQKTARTDGRSPAAIRVSTFSDELSLAQGGSAKVFGVSVKDRGAIAMAGHSGSAFWFSKKSGSFITSSFYYEKYPAWVNEWNDGKIPQHYANTSWELLKPKAGYVFGDKDDRPYETALPGFGRTFPHAFGDGSNKYFTTFLTVSPAGDQITLDFAKALLAAEKLGDDGVTDYLSVSFSSTDYVGHMFGPSSLEAEDNFLQLDKTLANLLSFVDKTVGLDKTLILLSSDHGGPEAPGFLREMGFESEYIDPASFDKTTAIKNLKQQFGIGEKLITTYFHPYLYLNRKIIEEKGLDLAEVEKAVVSEISGFDGIALAVSSQALSTGQVADTPIMRSVLNNYDPKRSGDIYIVFEPNRFINEFSSLKVAATHGSPWRYDTYVPIIFAGMKIKPSHVSRLVHTTSIAPTLSFIMGVKPPTGAFAPVLDEVVSQK